MKRIDERLRLSAGDLSRHLGCGHLTLLNRAAAEGKLARPSWRDPALEILEQRGLIHERTYLDHLRERGLEVVETGGLGEEGATAADRARAAMRAGAGAIYQAVLQRDGWFGIADILLRVDRPSGLGPFSYEVIDTKLATETRGTTILQLCLYSELVADVQGDWPQSMHVVSPGEGFPRQTYRLADFLAYYRLSRRRLLEALAADRGPESIYPEPVAQCDVCVWWKRCDERRRSDDHLSLVAGMQRLHARELRRQGVETLEHFAERGLPGRPERGAPATFERLRHQARVQAEGRREERPLHERLPAEPGMGLARLPAPDPGDVFLDLEGDRFVEGDGREYLLGFAWREDGGALAYRGLWGLDRAAERRSFEELIDFLLERWEAHPGMHVYHFAPYEPAALKRLMGRHATREDDVDRLLRGGRFVDLYDVVRHGVRASVESYSIKELERFTGYERRTDLREAVKALRAVSLALAMGAAGDLTDEIRDGIESYNRDDCLSTAALQGWLEKVRDEAIAAGEAIERPPEASGDPSERIEERRAEVQAIYDRLVEGIPDEPADRAPEQSARWLLAQLLDYFRREDKGTWWEYFRMRDLSDEDRLDERKAVSGLEFVREDGGTARSPVRVYRFPPQEMALRDGDDLCEPGEGKKIGGIVGVDPAARTLRIKMSGSAVAAPHPTSAFAHKHFNKKVLEGSLLALAEWVAENGIDAPGPHRAARDLLLRLPPRLREAEDDERRGEAGSVPEPALPLFDGLAGGSGAPAAGDGPAGASLRRPGENVVDAARRLALALDGGILPVQGPPGSGKTYIGGRIIVSLLEAGRTVGVTAIGHRVIDNLLRAALDAARKEKEKIFCVHKDSGEGAELPAGLRLVGGNPEALAAIDTETAVGGTAWLWSRPEFEGAVDTLIVDEAGQMSLAQVLAVSRAARNVILLGDPQQLQQPQQGSHPDGADAAALVHILGDDETLPDERGLFLDETWRLAPPIADLTSELYYEKRLRSHAGLEKQAILGDHPLAGSGLWVVPVRHEGNQSSAPEEVDAVDRIVSSLLAAGLRWRDRDGKTHPLTESDVLVVSPYNAQVFALQERRPTLNVGTVDRFQGQEAPIVLYSMAASSPDDAPRGMAFLYEPNRFNVATSRAQCACILVASPKLFEPECLTVETMRWANGLCRFAELAKVAPLPELEGTAGRG